MKKTIFAAALTCAMALGLDASAQLKNSQNWADERWEGYNCILNGANATFKGFTYGAEELDPIKLVKTGEGKYDVSGHAAYSKATYRKVKQGDSYMGLLLLYTSQNELAKVLFQGCDLSEKANKITYDMLQGEYTDAQGKKVVIKGNDIKVGSQNYSYSFFDNQYNPSAFEIDDEKYIPEFTLEGVKIYHIKFEGSSVVPNKNKVWMTLKRSNAKPMYDFLTNDIVLNLPQELSTKDLRIIRNEIYARHGWTFSSADLKEYFSKKPWYKPLGNNNSIKLNEMETINVERIKYWEKHWN